MQAKKILISVYDHIFISIYGNLASYKSPAELDT